MHNLRTLSRSGVGLVFVFVFFVFGSVIFPLIYRLFWGREGICYSCLFWEGLCTMGIEIGVE